MEDKIVEFMEKLYGELSSFRNETNKRFDMVDKRFDMVDKRFGILENDVKGLQGDVKGLQRNVLRIESDLKPKVEIALDGYKVVYEKLTSLEEKVDNINAKVEKQDVEIRVIRGAKSI